MSPGVLYGVGLGPGDPELITLKAARLIASSPIVAYPALAGADSFARRIASGLITPDHREIAIDVPMTTARAPAQEAYDAGADEIATALRAGQDVVCLCEGDPFFYGSFMYLFARLSAEFDTHVIPGVTSVTACAARAGMPLAARNERVTTLSAPAIRSSNSASGSGPGRIVTRSLRAASGMPARAAQAVTLVTP
ncbi:MAG: precorrin-2 C(20)-methyltransferase, partial [Pseudomonadota bacterium]